MMNGYDHEECDYLHKLRRRNIESGFENYTEPLSKPMSSEEKELRSGIREKCCAHIDELAWAQLAGLLPDKENRFDTATEAIMRIIRSAIIESTQKNEQKELMLKLP